MLSSVSATTPLFNAFSMLSLLRVPSHHVRVSVYFLSVPDNPVRQGQVRRALLSLSSNGVLAVSLFRHQPFAVCIMFHPHQVPDRPVTSGLEA